MTLRTLGALVALPLLLAGCGDSGGTSDSAGQATGSAPTGPTSTCAPTGSPRGQIAADLDGDGKPDSVGYVSGSCGDAVVATVGGRTLAARLSGDLPRVAPELEAVQLPGRQGELVLAKQSHPRGGFQATLFGYADGSFEQLTADGGPIFDFIATDVLTTPTAAGCVDGGFDVTVARAHQPVGVVHAWDVFRTVYTVEGNTVTKGATTKIADNVLDRALQRQYGDLVDYSFFDNC